MKHGKKFASLFLALILALAMALPVMADGEQPTEPMDGSVTITNAKAGQTYTIYKMFDLSWDGVAGEDGAYSYTVNPAWKDFFGENGAGKNYVTIENGYVKNVGNNDADRAAFAKAALAYATEIVDGKQRIAPAADAKTPSVNGQIQFTGLPYGYYLVDSTVGALCSLGTTNKNAAITDKNDEPTIEKKVKENSNNEWGGTNDASIGDTVEYQATITAQAGAQNYVMHDKMDEGLTYKRVSGVTLNGVTVAPENNYRVVVSDATQNPNPIADGCTFEVIFTDDFQSGLNANDKIVVSYEAEVNEKAVIGGVGNKNETWLHFGDDNDSTHSETITHVWEMKIFKDNEKKEALANATFNLTKLIKVADETAGIEEERATIKFTQEENTTVYRVDKNSTTDTIITDSTGKFTIKGLDSGVYYLKEIQAPAGYNILKDPVQIIISNKGQVTVNGNITIGEVEVINKTGSVLPGTGGIGTTIFYIVGGILVIGAGILLVAKKRAGSVK